MTTTTANNNPRPTAAPDTTPLVAHRDVLAAVAGTLVKRGRSHEQLEDDVHEVLARAIEAARRGPMPKDVAEWKALATTIAPRYAIDARREANTRRKYEVDLCDGPDAHGPLERATPRDPVDTRRHLGVLEELLGSGQMPERGVEILWGVAEEVSQKEIGEETGLTERQVEYRLRQMRRVFAARLAPLQKSTSELRANRPVPDLLVERDDGSTGVRPPTSKSGWHT